MDRIAIFSKISPEQYMKDLNIQATPEQFNELWVNIKFPTRATEGSAGYDFYLPYDVCFTPEEPTVIYTGISAIIKNPGYVLCLFPRSGLSFKYGTKFANTIPVIDSDYSKSDNEGHIIVKIAVDKPFNLRAGERFMQGIFLPYGITIDDEPLNTRRNGGFGSTGLT